VLEVRVWLLAVGTPVGVIVRGRTLNAHPVAAVRLIRPEVLTDLVALVFRALCVEATLIRTYLIARHSEVRSGVPAGPIEFKAITLITAATFDDAARLTDLLSLKTVVIAGRVSVTEAGVATADGVVFNTIAVWVDARDDVLAAATAVALLTGYALIMRVLIRVRGDAIPLTVTDLALAAALGPTWEVALSLDASTTAEATTLALFVGIEAV
jgi:hypothetical protein